MPLGEGGQLPHCIRAQDTQGPSLARVQAHNEVTHARISEIDLAQGLFGRQLRGKQAGHAKFGGLRSQRLHEQGQVKIEFSELFVVGLLQRHERWDLIHHKHDVIAVVGRRLALDAGIPNPGGVSQDLRYFLMGHR